MNKETYTNNLKVINKLFKTIADENLDTIDVQILLRVILQPGLSPKDHYEALKLPKSLFHRHMDYLAARKPTKSHTAGIHDTDRPAYLRVDFDPTDIRRRVLNPTPAGENLVCSLIANLNQKREVKIF
ncbi:hypothetical protein [Alteromonas gracilis]|uniref:hypothetical protein n=1 Tax=Alteromonas gracilis TaxID=1479524 RepID=UPI002FE1631F